MDTLSAFMLSEANRGRERMVFDWEKAAQIIKKSNATTASAGLRGDWEYTGGRIWKDGKPCTDSYTYLASTWSTRQLKISGKMYDCYRMESETPGWGAKTKWPPEALAIIGD